MQVGITCTDSWTGTVIQICLGYISIKFIAQDKILFF